MNEVTKVHLGRQAFTISITAQKELRTYLDAIENQVDDKDVVEEVELRMAELLTEHGIKGNKVARYVLTKGSFQEKLDFTKGITSKLSIKEGLLSIAVVGNIPSIK